MASRSRPKSSSLASNRRPSARKSTRASSRAEASARTSSTRGANSRNASQQRSVRTVGEIRKASRSQDRASRLKRAAKATRWPLVIIAVLFGAAVLAGIFYATLANSDTFRIQNVSITGAEHLTEEETSALVTIPENSTLLNVDVDAIKASLLRDSWVESVDVVRQFPMGLEIKITERKLGAIAEVPLGTSQTIQKWALAEDGTWLMAIPEKTSEIGQKISPQIYTDADAALHIKSVPYGVQPKIGAYCTDDSVLNALEIINGMTTDLQQKVKGVVAADKESTVLTLTSNIEIAFGRAENIREKERICNEIISQNPKVVYINVRVPDRPTWRSA